MPATSRSWQTGLRTPLTLMRIPSQFNETSLYRRQPQAGERNAAIRKLFRLGVAMALLIVVMRQAGHRELYEPFFPNDASVVERGIGTNGPATQHYAWQAASGRPPSGPAFPVQTAKPADSVEAERMEEPRNLSELNASAKRIVDAIPVAQQRWWMAALWHRLRLGEPVALGFETQLDWETARRATAMAELSEVIAVDATQPTDNVDQQTNNLAQANNDQQAWLASLQRLLNGEPLTGPDRNRLSALARGLDEAAMERTVDGATWRASDFDAFYWSLAQAASGGFGADLAGSPRRAENVGALPLLQQPSIYRGQTVRLSGRVARAHSLQAAENAFGLQRYWQTWLQPDDGSDQPVLLVTPTVPARVAIARLDRTHVEGPKVQFVGRYLKRFAYRSAAGVEVAPALIGRIVDGKTPLASKSAPDADSFADSSRAFAVRLIATLLIATAVGVILAAFMMWRTTAEAKRIRRLRHAHQAKSDFDPDKLGTMAGSTNNWRPESTGDGTADSGELG